MSQGIGYFQHDKSQIYVGATPLSVLQGIQCEVCEPSADLSQNSIAPEITKCWYNSTEVTSSGHTLHALTATNITNNTHLEYQSIFVEGYDLSKYRVGDLVKISGAENEWVVLPAFQDTAEHYPEQLSSDWEVRARNNYRNNYDHVRRKLTHDQLYRYILSIIFMLNSVIIIYRAQRLHRIDCSIFH